MCSDARAQDWEPVGPEGGNILGTVTDPSDANHVIAVEAASRQAFESLDGAGSWSFAGDVGASSLNDFAGFSPAKIYAIDYYRCYRSTDGGNSWLSSTFPAGSGYARVLCVHPTDSNTVYVAGYKYDSGTYRLAFWRSADGGQSWTAGTFFTLDYVYPYDMAVSRTAPGSIYVSGSKRPVGGSTSVALFKSTDGGSSWSDLSSSVGAVNDYYLYGVAVDPSDSNRVYTVMNYIYYSTNAGTSWVKGSYVYSFALAVDPESPNRVYAAGNNYVRVSTNYGLAWTTYSGAIDGVANKIEVATANPSNVLVSTPCGLYRSSNAGATWASAVGGIRSCVCPSIAFAPSRPGRAFVECLDIGVYGTEDGGDSWTEKGYFVACGDVAALAVHPTNPDIVLALEGAG
ncbi:MAG: hypothetical protein JXR37_13765 [Kiritimatiellae bacterium]|nr:hypothetical protein [Kiritimatiellia bacterium]